MLFGPSREQQGETQPVRKAAMLVPTAGTSPAGPLSALSMGLALARVTVANVLHSILYVKASSSCCALEPVEFHEKKPHSVG